MDLITSPNTFKKMMLRPKLLIIMMKQIQKMELLPIKIKPISDIEHGWPGQRFLAFKNSRLPNITCNDAIH